MAVFTSTFSTGAGLTMKEKQKATKKKREEEDQRIRKNVPQPLKQLHSKGLTC